jgi:antitoxin VapB
MPLNIRNEETEELAGALARVKRRRADEVDEIALHCSTLPVLDRRTADEIIDYDENGIPR